MNYEPLIERDLAAIPAAVAAFARGAFGGGVLDRGDAVCGAGVRAVAACEACVAGVPRRFGIFATTSADDLTTPSSSARFTRRRAGSRGASLRCSIRRRSTWIRRGDVEELRAVDRARPIACAQSDGWPGDTTMRTLPPTFSPSLPTISKTWHKLIVASAAMRLADFSAKKDGTRCCASALGDGECSGVGSREWGSEVGSRLALLRAGFECRGERWRSRQRSRLVSFRCRVEYE